jgi:hypothetical protein
MIDPSVPPSSIDGDTHGCPVAEVQQLPVEGDVRVERRSGADCSTIASGQQYLAFDLTQVSPVVGSAAIQFDRADSAYRSPR